MRRIVVEEFVSLDGVAEGPGRFGEFEHRGWTVPYWGDDVEKWHTDQLLASDCASARPGDLRGVHRHLAQTETRRTAPGIAGGGRVHARMNSLPKFVASTTLAAPLEWNSTLLAGELAEAVAELKERPGADILVYGSSELVNALMPFDLVDEYRLMIYPVVLGRGKRFFRDDNGRTTLALMGSQTSSTGVTMLVLEPRR